MERPLLLQWEYLFRGVLAEVHHDLSHLSAGRGAGGIEHVQTSAGQQALAHRPGHSSLGPGGGRAAVHILAQVGLGTGVIALALSIVVQDQSQLLPG